MEHVRDLVRGMNWGSHVCMFYRNAHALLQFQIPYFLDGLKAGHACIWLVNQPLEVQAALEALSLEIPDIAAFRSSGQLEVLDAGKHYDSNDSGPETAAQFWAERESSVRSQGYPGLRISGNVSGEYGDEAWQALMVYEHATDSHIHVRSSS